MTDGATYEKAKQHLLTVANLLAPSGVEQRLFAKAVGSIERDPMDNDQKLRHIVGMLYDGLAYGNWPI